MDLFRDREALVLHLIFCPTRKDPSPTGMRRERRTKRVGRRPRPGAGSGRAGMGVGMTAAEAAPPGSGLSGGIS